MEYVIAAPQFAPLSKPMVLHLLGIDAAEFVARASRRTDAFLQELRALEQRVSEAREHIFTLLSEEQGASPNNISVKWFRATLPAIRHRSSKTSSATGKPVSLQAVAGWKESNVLRFQKWGVMDLDSAAAVLIIASIDERERHFLPSTTSINEPIWWCYSQAPPTRRGTQAPIVPLPIPLPLNLEPGTLLWSSWPSFDPAWIQFPHVGSIRFSSLTKETLSLWDNSLSNTLLDLHNNSLLTEQALMRIAQSTLYKLAIGRIGVTTPDLSLLWKPSEIWPNEIFA